MKNGGKNKSVAFIILFSIITYLFNVAIRLNSVTLVNTNNIMK